MTETTIDRYVLEEPLGRGGFSTVYRARHSLIGNKVAFKLLSSQHTSNKVTMERFVREAQTAASIGNPHIVKVLDCGTSPQGDMFLVMELLEGEELTQLIEASAPLEVSRAVDYTLQVLDGLASAHAAGIVHRDIKPGNIYLVKAADGTNSFVKLLDFGISKILDSSVGALTNAGEVLGTPMYMAPEQILGADQVDHRCDLYGVSAVLYHMLTGQTPHNATSLPEMAHMLLTETPATAGSLNPAISQDLDAIIMRGLAREPEDRWPNASELAGALMPFCPEYGRAVLPSGSMPGFSTAEGFVSTSELGIAAQSRPTGPMAQVPVDTYPMSESSLSPLESSSELDATAAASPTGLTPDPQDARVEPWSAGQDTGESTFAGAGDEPRAREERKGRKKLPLWLIFVLVGVAATLLGGVTVTIAAFAMGSFTSTPSTPSTAGTHAVQPGTTGTVTPPTKQPPAGNQGLIVGRPTMGTLALGQRFNHPLTVSRAGMVTITLQSTDFDTYLYLLQGTNVINSDDDGGGGYNSQLVMYLQPGTYTVQVGAFQETGAGRYVVTVFQPN